jgi:hypothetical protein
VPSGLSSDHDRALTRIAFSRFDEPATGDWTSAWIEPGFPVVDVVPSWNAETPPGTAIAVALQGRDEAGETPWYSLGTWASGDDLERTSVPGQDDGRCRVQVDTLVADGGLDAFRLRVTPLTADGVPPYVRLVAAVASSGRSADPVVPSEPSLAGPLVLDVPPFSQFRHRGHFPEYDGGGASWCSAASTAMLVAYWGRGPTPEDMAWVGEEHDDPWVDHAARSTYDAAYAGCGNWPFNTAYAASFGLEAFVTRLTSLREAEAFLEAGVPLGASIAAAPGELDGFIGAGTAGHIVVLAGVTAGGDPVVADPAAHTNGEVRRTYDRAQLERAWLGGSGGIVYVVRPPGVSLPPGGGAW